MKKLFFSLVALAVAAMSYAQSTLVATLSHDGNISTFYGATALKEAYETAVDGNIITLSSGNFHAVDIYKSLTIRGAGMDPNPATGTLPTIIDGDFSISGDNCSVTLEGIFHNNATVWCDNDNATFIKCRLSYVQKRHSNWRMKNYNFINCRIIGVLRIPYYSHISCTNSIINYPENHLVDGDTWGGHNNIGSFDFTNCIVCRGDYSGECFYKATMRNCIYMENEVKAPLDPSVVLYNTVCVCANKNGIDLLANVSNNTNSMVEGFSNIFATFSRFTGELPDEAFELTDEAKTTYLGLDGKQVGIYGGSLPFDPTVSGPQITRCNVASKSTADGKLSVDIEVKVNQ